VNRAQPTSGYGPVAAIDPGIDGVAGTGDDRPWTVYERTVAAGSDNYLTNANTGEYYDTIAVSVTKRFANGDQIIAGVDQTQRHLGDSTNFDPNTLWFNGPNRAVTKQWDWKLLGTHILPWSMSLSGSISAQKGEPYARTVNFTPALLVNHPAALAQGSTTVTVQPSGSYYLPSIYQTTLHLERRFRGLGKGHTFTGLFELYNIQNANTIIGISTATGVTTDNTGKTVPSFARYTQALNPRIARLGVKYQF